jgi:hypothetical protein
LQTLADTLLEVFNADSAGISLLTADEKHFHWAAIAGAWAPHIGGGTPREFGPCGDVLDRKTPLLFRHWEVRYPYLAEATPLAEEGLLVPFFVSGKAVGTARPPPQIRCRRSQATREHRTLCFGGLPDSQAPE